MGLCEGKLSSAFVAEPRSCIIEKIVRDIFIYAVPAKVNKQHALDLAKDHQFCCVFAANETPFGSVFLMELIKLFVIVLHSVSHVILAFASYHILLLVIHTTLDLRRHVRNSR